MRWMAGRFQALASPLDGTGSKPPPARMDDRHRSLGVNRNRHTIGRPHCYGKMRAGCEEYVALSNHAGSRSLQCLITMHLPSPRPIRRHLELVSYSSPSQLIVEKVAVSGRPKRRPRVSRGGDQPWTKEGISGSSSSPPPAPNVPG